MSQAMRSGAFHSPGTRPAVAFITALLLTTLLLGSSGCALQRAATEPLKKPLSPPLFVDVAEKAGVSFSLGHNGKTPLTILETLGSGGGFLDCDGDGWLDIVLVGPNKTSLFRNNGDGTFADATAGSGLRQTGIWQGVATGDYDNDGRADLFVSGYRDAALYHNEGAGRFREVTKTAGLASKLWGASAAFFDADNDGRLDLLVTHYVQFLPTSTKFCLQGGLMSTCGPTNYDPEKPTLYRNNGDGTFSDETKKRGLGDAHGNALGVAIADYDDDGDVDFAVANDQLPGDLYKNDGKGHFKNVALLAGTAYNADGSAYAGMGVDWADYKNDGRAALVATAYQHQPTCLYEQTAPGLFADVGYTAGIGPATRENVGFGIKFLDYDNDGRSDVLVANGHAVDNIAKTDRTTTYAQLPQLFHNMGAGRFEEVTEKAGPAFAASVVGRGLCVGDYDNDGRVDALLTNIEGRVLLLHNEGAAAKKNHFLVLRLQGGPRSNRDALGARVRVTAGGLTQQALVTTAGSFLSASDVRVHLGLGPSVRADRVEIRWPSGRKTVLTNVAADRFLRIVEGNPAVAVEERKTVR